MRSRSSPNFAPQVFDVPSQLTDVLSHILPQPAIACQDQPGLRYFQSSLGCPNQPIIVVQLQVPARA